jgi:hypothetical protein
MRQVYYSVGLGKDKHNRDIDFFAREVLTGQALRAAIDTFGGCSLIEGPGGWNSPAHGMVVEPSVGIQIFTTAPDAKIKKFGEFLRDLFRQETVLVAVIPAAVTYV